MRAAFRPTRVLATWSLLSLMACGGGGDGGDPATGSTDRTTIEGRVTGVATASVAGNSAGTTGALVSGIRVEAQRAGQVLDVATTDVEGRFTLDFTGGGSVELVFVTDQAVLRLEIDALPGSVITLVVQLRIVEEEVVVIDDPILESGPIRCEGGTFSIVDDALDLVIDGRGDDCVRAENHCVVDIAVRSLTLVDCERCIDAHSSAEVMLSAAPGGVTCEAREDGIRALSSSFVAVDGLDFVDILSAGGHGIRAESSAEVVLVSDGTCFIEATDDPIRMQSQAIVDLNGCADVVFLGDVDDDDDDDDNDSDDDDDDDFDDDDDDFGDDDDD